MRAWVAALLLLTPLAAALTEDQAPMIDDRVVRAWHEPAIVQPGTQWQGFLQLREDSNVTAASYQVCNVADGVCFAPPQPAQAVAAGTFGFDTSNYTANGQPIRYEAGWRLGVKWYLQLADGTTDCLPAPCPNGTAGGSLDDHYLTFDLPRAPAHGAPGLPLAALMALILLAASARRPKP
jgi:hypothetical protein